MDERKDRINEALEYLVNHTDPKEGSIPDLLSDAKWANEYMAIKVTDRGFGVKFACSPTPEEVYLAIRNDRKQNPDSMYYLYKPAVLGQEREGLLMGGLLK